MWGGGCSNFALTVYLNSPYGLWFNSAIQSCRLLPVFEKSLSPPSLGYKMKAVVVKTQKNTMKTFTTVDTSDLYFY